MKDLLALFTAITICFFGGWVIFTFGMTFPAGEIVTIVGSLGILGLAGWIGDRIVRS